MIPVAALRPSLFVWASCVLLLSVATLCPAQDQVGLAEWPRWRGPLDTGEAPQAKPPLKWDGETNIAWTAKPEGFGHSTPIVWKNRVFLTAGKPIGEPFAPRPSKAPGAHDNLPVTHQHSFFVTCLDWRTGAQLWSTECVSEIPHDTYHVSASPASASPVTDGQRVYASFGSLGVFCLNFDGEILWRRTLGALQIKHGHGEGSSPTIADGVLVVNGDHEGDSYIAALDAASGETLWRRSRDEPTSWATPIVVRPESGEPQVVVSGTGRIRGYALRSGAVVWECGGLSSNVVASPVFSDNRLFAGSSYDTRAMLAINLAGAQGDLSDTEHVLWRRRRLTPYVPSPLHYRGAVYFLGHYQAVLSRLDAESGQDAGGPFRLNGLGNIYASPVAADGRVYVTDRNGVTLVMSAGDKPEVLSVNRLPENVNASLALVRDSVLIRGEKRVYRIREPE